MKLILPLVPYLVSYAMVWVVVRVVTALVLRFCDRCELSCLQHINMLGNVFSVVGLGSAAVLLIERAPLFWSPVLAILAAFGIHALSRKLRPQSQ